MPHQNRAVIKARGACLLPLTLLLACTRSGFVCPPDADGSHNLIVADARADELDAGDAAPDREFHDTWNPDRSTADHSQGDISTEDALPDALVQDGVVEDAVVEDAVVEDAVVEDAVVQDAVVQDAVVQDAHDAQDDAGTTALACIRSSSSLPYDRFGSGTQSDPYVLCQTDQWLDLVDRGDGRAFAAHYVLAADLDFAESTVSPLGYCEQACVASTASTRAFSGSLDGNGFGFLNIVIGAEPSRGLFAVLWNATIRNLRLDISNNSSGGRAGLLAGSAYASRIENIDYSGTVSSIGDEVGGLVGNASGVFFRDIRGSVLSVAGASSVGGLVGQATHSWIESVHVRGSITRTGQAKGGLVGAADVTAIVACRFEGGVEGSYDVGGIVGRLNSSETFQPVRENRVTADINCSGSCGGIVGYSLNAYVSENVVEAQISSIGDDIGGVVGAISGLSNSDLEVANNLVRSTTVTGVNNVGGVVGNAGTFIHSNYADASVAGITRVGGIAGIVRPSGSTGDNAFAGDIQGVNSTGAIYGGNDGSVSEDFYWAPNGVQNCVADCNSYGTRYSTHSELNDQSNAPLSRWDFVGEATQGQAELWTMNADGIGLWIEGTDTAPSPYAGDGSSGDPYQLGSPQDLLSLGDHPRLLGAHFVLTSHIDFAGDVAQILPRNLVFKGVLDGAGYTILNGVARGGVAGRSCALIPHNGGTLRNLYIDQLRSDCYHYKGNLTAINFGIIEDTAMRGSVEGAGSTSLGIAAAHNGGVIRRVQTIYQSGNGRERGAVCGQNFGVVQRCEAQSWTNAGDDSGGIVGVNEVSGIVEDSYAKGSDLNMGNNVGGCIGVNKGIARRLYSTLNVSAEANVGGCIGHQELSGRSDALFSTGNVVATTAGNRVIGRDDSGASATLYSWDGSSSSHSDGAPYQELSTAELHDSQSACYDTWDAQEIWFYSGTQLPLLRSLPYAAF